MICSSTNWRTMSVMAFCSSVFSRNCELATAIWGGASRGRNRRRSGYWRRAPRRPPPGSRRWARRVRRRRLAALRALRRQRAEPVPDPAGELEPAARRDAERRDRDRALGRLLGCDRAGRAGRRAPLVPLRAARPDRDRAHAAPPALASDVGVLGALDRIGARPGALAAARCRRICRLRGGGREPLRPERRLLAGAPRPAGAARHDGRGLERAQLPDVLAAPSRR